MAGGGGGRGEAHLEKPMNIKCSSNMGLNKPSKAKVSYQKLYNELHELHDLFFAKHFLLFRYIAFSPWVFYYQKRSSKQRFILSKGFQDFNKCSCHYNSIKRKMTGLLCLVFTIKQKSIYCIVLKY